MRSPFRPRPEHELYYYDANYHRLNYQYAAQLLHRELAPDFGKSPAAGPKRRRTFLGLASGSAKVSGAGQDSLKADEELLGQLDLPSARRAADRARREAEEVCREFKDRRRRGKVTRWLRLSDGEKRLYEFLRRTVIPCLELVSAGAERQEKNDETAQDVVAPLLQKAKKGSEEISYRAIYNLACFEAGGTGSSQQAAAINYLRDAFRLVPGDRRDELAGWAWRDPSLDSIRTTQKNQFADAVGPPARPLPGQSGTKSDPS
jgi:hypothetical protein